jgi:hypothetical protein
MGFSLTWVAARGKSRDRVLADLELQGTDAWEELPESPITGAQIPGDWYAVIFNGDITAIFAGDALRRLSTGAEVVVCTVEEHVMCSGAFGWKNGREVWSVRHDAQVDADGIAAAGKLPQQYAAIAGSARAQRDAADTEGAADQGADFLFDVPIELAQALTGYRHDRDIPGLRGPQFEVLVNRRKAGKWFTRWAE